MLAPNLLFSDEVIVVINKPAGMVMHEGAGEVGETVVDWFVKNYPEVADQLWSERLRPGIVHRLDKDTSGVVALAKTPDALCDLQSQFKNRTIKKIYFAIVYGVPKQSEGTIETFIGRHPKRRQQQTVLSGPTKDQKRREAVTHYEVQKSREIVAGKEKGIVCLVRFEPKTGRMHQLRVHAKYLGTPIIGDPIYNTKPSKRLSKSMGVERQLLHAQALTFRHPATGHRVTFEAPWPNDFRL